MKISAIGEFALIELMQKQLPGNPATVIKGIGDDTAVLQGANGRVQLLTTDMLIEEVHFSFAYASPWQVGAKALNVNISDIAAMGGTSTFATVAIGIPRDTEARFVEEIYRGIGDMAARYGVAVVGGDTVSAPVLVINITLMGEAPESGVIYRGGARAGDSIFVTGGLGGSAAGLYHLSHPEVSCREEVARELVELHLLPVPRVEESRYLAGTGVVTSMNDISDGLASELHEICTASGVGCEIYADKIPVPEAARDLAGRIDQDALEWALSGGEDFQLVFTVPKDKAPQVIELMQEKGKPVVHIGEITGEGMIIIDSQGERHPLSKGGYNHFTAAG